MGIELNDWRLQGQEMYLTKKTFLLKRFAPASETDDHEHCTFCWKKFSLQADDEHEGYVTLDNLYWICKSCFNDFKGFLHAKSFYPASFEGKTFLQIVLSESSPLDGRPGLYIAKHIIEMCNNLRSLDLTPDKFEITPAIAIMWPKSTRIILLDECRCRIPNETVNQVEFCSAIKESILALMENSEIRNTKEEICKTFPPNLLAECILINSDTESN